MTQARASVKVQVFALIKWYRCYQAFWDKFFYGQGQSGPESPSCQLWPVTVLCTGWASQTHHQWCQKDSKLKAKSTEQARFSKKIPAFKLSFWSLLPIQKRPAFSDKACLWFNAKAVKIMLRAGMVLSTSGITIQFQTQSAKNLECSAFQTLTYFAS